MEPGQPFQVFQPGASDLGMAEFELFEAYRFHRVFVSEIQLFKAGQPFQVFQPRARELIAGEVQLSEIGQLVQLFYVSVSHLAAVEAQLLGLGQRFQVSRPVAHIYGCEVEL